MEFKDILYVSALVGGEPTQHAADATMQTADIALDAGG